MKITWQQLNHLEVITQSGSKLGIVEGVSLDVESHAVFQYHVKPARTLLGLFPKELLVSPAEVVSMDDKAMIVRDSVANLEPATGNKKTRLAFSAPKGIEMSETE